MRLIAGVVCALAAAGAVATNAAAAPPAPGGLEPLAATPCIGSTTLATGCPVASPVVQAAEDIAISADGRTLYVATAYAGGAVAAIRRNADGTLGPVLNCAAATPSADCGTVVPSLYAAEELAVGPAGQVLVVTESGMSGAITALAVGADGSLGGMLNCVVSPGGYSYAAGCTERTGIVLPLDVAVSPGGTLYITSFAGYTQGTVVALATGAGGAIGDELSCYSTTGINPSYACPTNSTGRIASPTSAVVGPGGTVYVTSSEYQASYGVVTAFPTDPGGALQAPSNCVSDPGATYPSTPCATTAPGLKGARALAISSDGRLYVAAAPYDGTSGSVAAFGLQASGAIGAALNCLGSSVATGCPAAAGLRGVSGLAIAGDGTVYTSANYSSTDGAAAALARQPNGAFSNEINCVGVTSATGCDLRMPGLAGANGIVGSPDPAMQDVYVAARYASGLTASGTDGAVAALTRELAPACAGGAASTVAGQPVTVGLGCSDPNGDALTRTIVAAPGHGTLGPVDDNAGTAVYQPAAGFIGQDTFTVQATDGTLGSPAGTVTVDVAAAPPPVARVAKVTRFTMTRKRFAVGSKRTALSAVKRGTKFRYAVDLASQVRITIAKCRRGTGKARRKLCARRKKVGALTRSARVGAGSVAFSGRLGRKPLKPGRYRATIVATPAAPAKPSAPRSVEFVVVKG